MASPLLSNGVGRTLCCKVNEDGLTNCSPLSDYDEYWYWDILCSVCPAGSTKSSDGSKCIVTVEQPQPGPKCAMAGNPVDPVSGNKYQSELDLRLGGLRFERWYNSLDTKPTSLGGRWRHTFERSIKALASNLVEITRADGKRVFFSRSSTGAWEPPQTADGKLTYTVDGTGAVSSWTLRRAGAKEQYDGQGRLLSISESGNTFNLTYDPTTSRLATVTDLGGRTLSFGYDPGGRLVSVLGSDGAEVAYGYDGAGNLQNVSLPGGALRQYVYDSPYGANLLTGIIDERGVRIATWAYDSSRRAISSQHAGGADAVNVSVAYDNSLASGALVSYAGGPSYSLDFQKLADGTSALSGVTGGGSAQLEYLSNGTLTARTDGLGVRTTYGSDNYGHFTAVNEASGGSDARTTSYVWDTALNRLTSMSNSKTRVAFGYDTDGGLISMTTSDVSVPSISATVTFTRTNGRVTAIDGPRTDVADVSTVTYDAAGAPATATNALGHTVTFLARDAAGRPTSVRDPNGLVGTMTYGPRGETTSLDSGEGVTLSSYDAALNLVGSSHPATGATTYTYDDNSRLVLMTTPQGWSKRFAYDGASHLIKEETLNALGTVVRTVTVVRDSMGRPISFTGASSTDKITYTYDVAGNLTQVTNGLNYSIKYTLDGLERITSVTDGKGQKSTMAYDVNDRLASRVDARAHTTSFVYDGLGRATSVVTPDAGTVSKTYDAAGNVKTVTDAAGRTSTRSYDALGRPTSIAYADGKTETFRYDEGTNALGNLTTATTSAGDTLSWTYDAHGRAAGSLQSAGGSVRSAAVTRDAYGRPSSYTLPSGARVSLAYDATGLVTQLSVNDVAMISNVTYAPFGGVTGWRWGNGRLVSRAKDANDHIASYTLGTASYNLTYDAAGRISAIGGGASRTFSYDAANRLTGSTGPEGNRAYAYDATGNRTSITVGSTTTATVVNTANDRIVSIGAGGSKRTFKYAADGAVTDDGQHTYQYNSAGRISSVDLGLWRYAYDALGRRVVKSKSIADLASWAPGDVNRDGIIDQRDLTLVGQMISGQVAKVTQADCNGDKKYTTADVTCVEGKARTDTVFFSYDAAGTLVGEYDGLGTAIREYVYFEGVPAFVLKGGTVYFIDVDQIGTPRLVSDSAGRAVWQWSSDAFGDALPNENPSGLGTFTMPLRFSGHYHDAESGRFYNVHRYYDPGTGRYLQPDPLGLRGGDNVYEYVKSDPMRATDPLGASPVDASNSAGAIRFALGEQFGGGVPTIFAAGIIHPWGSQKLAEKLEVVRRILDEQGGNGRDFYYVPNGGSLVSDIWDAWTNRGDADSVRVMHDLLKTAADKKQCVDVIAHSNGNAVVADALQQLLEEGYESPIRNFTGIGPNASFESLNLLAHNTVSPFVIVNTRDVALPPVGNNGVDAVLSGAIPGVSLSWGLFDGNIRTHDMLQNYMEAVRQMPNGRLHQGSPSGRCACAQ